MNYQSLSVSLPEDFPSSFPEAALSRIREILKVSRNFDIGSYKDKYIKRRIAIRARATRCRTIDDYCELLFRNDGELDLLVKGLTIHVSQFFRNRSAFDKLEREILPVLFNRLRKEGRQSTTFWSVGCASGEEPYTLAMILAESFPAELKEFKVTLMATDINRDIIDVAKKGLYASDRLREVPDALRECYFAGAGERFCLRDDIRAMVDFAAADLFDSSSYVESDLVLCRNVLIYFERGEQERIIQRLANVLPTEGILVLGKAETLVGESRRRFTTVCPVERIYMKNRFSIY
ncbi:CheR family methyltransferase [Geotalea uraniireducens]|uniref:CheR family methyltransferase n=1 Tax=Geotalea uraniireducens TaxID=351604 RepID=UPI002492D3E0|nr:protein-glutamate O-methyltransferase CheR [Geotalea uraniireducens]